MKRDSRLSRVLHILLHMAERKEPVTSEVLAGMLATHPVVVRQIMAGLRKQGYVRSEKGHGGGWTLTCDLSKVTLGDIHAALGQPALVAIGSRTETPDCKVEQTVNAALDEVFQATETFMRAQLERVTLARLSTDLHKRPGARGRSQPHRRNNHVH